MRIINCLQKMGFTEEEAHAIFEDAAGGDAKEIVARHIEALEAEKKSIMDQVAEQTGMSQRGPTDAKLSPPEVENPTMQIPDESGELVLATDAVKQADLELEAAKELSKGFTPAAECAVRFGT